MIALLSSAFAQDSLNVTRVGQIFAPAGHVAKSGNYAYFINGIFFYKVDVTYPTMPAIVCSVAVSSSFMVGEKILINGNNAYVYGGCLCIFNIGPSTPNLVYQDTLGYLDRWTALALSSNGTLGYVGCGNSGYGTHFKVFSMVIPPSELGSYVTPFEIENLAVNSTNDKTFAACTYWGFRVQNVFYPSNPVEIGFLSTPGPTGDIAFQGIYAYVTEDYAGLRVLDVSNPATPHQVGAVDLPGEAWGISVSGNYAAVACEAEGGLYIVNISTPSNPFVAGFYDTPGYASDVVLAGNYAYVSDDPYFGIYDCSAALAVQSPSELTPPAYFSLTPASPNPFNSSTTLRYTLQTPGSVRLQVYEITGRLVETLVNGWQEEGLHQAVFDGSKFPSGIYLYRLSAGSRAVTGKMALVK
jgi:hypothetical protein